MYRLEIVDKNGTHTENVGSEQYLDLASKKKGSERIDLLIQAVYRGHQDLEIFFEIIQHLVDKAGDNRKAYSIGVLAPKSREIPPSAKDHAIYHWKFDAYWSLAAHYSGFDDEAFRIQKNLIFYRGEAHGAMHWLTQNYNFYLQKIMNHNEIKTQISDVKKKESKVAVFFIGQYRSFDRTHYNIEQNFITPNNATAFVFCEDARPVSTLFQYFVDKWGKETVGGCSVTKNRPKEFHHITDYLFKTKKSLHPDKFNNCAYPTYITGSGSIVEYYYYSKCYELMLAYEKKHNVQFDIIVRTRLDIMVGQEMPLLSFFTKMDEERRREMADDGLYLSSLGSTKLSKEIRSGGVQEKKIDNLLEEINAEKYIWTLGPNQIWIGKRCVMSQLYSLIFLYGKYNSGKESTFNSETQFYMFCAERNIRHILLNAGTGGKWFTSRSKNNNLLKNAKDKVEDKNIVWSFIRMPWFNFSKP